MAHTPEPKIGLAVMRVLATSPNGTASVQTLVICVPDYVDLTKDDLQPSLTRPNEAVWEQRVRNLKSHDKTPGNVIALGFVERAGRATYRLTEAGWIHLKNKGLA